LLPPQARRRGSWKKIEEPTKKTKTAQKKPLYPKPAQKKPKNQNGTKRHKKTKTAQKKPKRHKKNQNGTKKTKTAQTGTKWPQLGPKVILLAAAVCLACRSLSRGWLRFSTIDSRQESAIAQLKHDIRPTRPTSCGLSAAGCVRLSIVLNRSHPRGLAAVAGLVRLSRQVRLWLQCRWLAGVSGCQCR
jgi:hypothetical protein